MQDNAIRKYTSKQVFLIILILIFCTGVLLWNTQINKKKILKQNEGLIERAVMESVDNINGLFSHAENSITLLSEIISDKIISKEFKPEILDDMMNNTPFDYVRFIDGNGQGITAEGIVFDVANRDYYIQGMKGLSGITFITNSVVNNKDMLIFYTPVYGENELIVGVMSGGIAANTIKEKLNNNYLDIEMRSYLCRSDGRLAVISSDRYKGENIFQEISKVDLVSTSCLEEIKQAFATGESFAYTYNGIEGEGKGYISSLDNKEWVILKAIPSTIIKNMTKEANKTAFYSSIIIILVFGGYVLMILYTYVQKSEEYSKENRQLKATVKQSSHQQKMQEEKGKELLTLAMRQAEEASAAKMNFLANISHDMRTPMNAIIGMTNVAAAYADDKEKVLDCLDKINYSGKHLLSLINEVLDMGKIESGTLKLKEEEINIPDFMSDMMILLRPQIMEKNHNFNLQIKHIKHTVVLGDRLRMRQCFVNILSNAVKYTPAGGNIDVLVTEASTGQNNISCYEFVFEDNGIGMSEDFLKRLYDPFEREEDSRINNIQGTGLGMAITKNIINMLHGDIKVESQINKGTRFVVTLYLKYVESFDNNETKQISETEKEVKMMQEEDFTGVRVLLVEDNELNREIAVELLEMTGAEITVAENGKAAVEKFAESTEYYYDIILMDIQMPQMNGYEASRAIRTMKREDAKSVAIIAMTANAFSEDIIAARDAGMDEHLAKPIDLKKIIAIFKEWA